ncbi:hypothetical protein [uncultured Deefgea sp.]|uniref:hypothetical protein n=1 Tax=uncultured Deefgea sp. TaxID=1304914 RepID=UPI0026306FD9|nr:hypothetical protein [uncultured Deefgea sp.]
MASVLLECGQCGKANKVETQFQISCGCCKAPLDTQAFRPYTALLESQQRTHQSDERQSTTVEIKSGVSKATTLVVATLTAVGGFFLAEYVSQRAAISPMEYRNLEACILGLEPASHELYQRKVSACTCAFNQAREVLAASPGQNFVVTFNQYLPACAAATKQY